MARLFRALWSVNPIWGAALSLCAGLLVVLASFPLNLAFVSYDVGGGLTKQVGFVPALNWSIVLVFLFPAAIFTALRTSRMLKRAFVNLPQHHMLARNDWSRATTQDAEALVSDVWRAAAPIGLFFLAIGLSVGFWDFKTVVLDPLTSGTLPVKPGATDFARELDWSVAALFGGISGDPLPSVTANLIFSSVAYLLLLGQISYLLSFFGLLIGVSVVLHRFSEEGQPVRLTPDATSLDRRRGFQNFEALFLGILSFSLLTYFCCYLMRVQNLFLRDQEHRRIDELLFNDIAASLGGNLPHDVQSAFGFVSKSALDIASAVFATGNLADTQSYLGIGMILIGMLLVVVSLFIILRGAAEESRQAVERDITDPEKRQAVETYYGVSSDALAPRLAPDGMDEWPLKWPRLNPFLAYMALGLACFFFYRLALLWVALQIWQLLRRWPKN